MSIDVQAAERFVLSAARLLDRHRLAVLLHGASPDGALAALAAYRNPDGGFGHALEPDVRTATSETTSTLHALDVLDHLGRLDHPWVGQAAEWIASVSHDDGGVPFVLPEAASAPHAPWMVPSDGGSHLTFALAAVFGRAGVVHPWLDRAREWCWARLEGGETPTAYTVKFALMFLDATDDEERAQRALGRLGALIGEDGTLPVAGGTEDERLTPLTLSPHPGARSRSLFTGEQIARDLDRLERGQADDGGWTFDWLAWSPGQIVEWRGALTVNALATLTEHERLPALTR